MSKRVTFETSLQALFPKLAEQWHPIRNGTATPNKLLPGSGNKVWWLCPRGEDHEWRTSPSKRTREGHGCPFCSHQKVSTTTSLAALYPELAKQWHPIKNLDTPERVLPQSHRVVWWVCPTDATHIWELRVRERVTAFESGFTRCPHCAATKPKFDHLAYNRQYYADNQDSLKQYSARYREDNKDWRHAKAKVYNIANPEMLLLNNIRNRARRRGQPVSITLDDIKKAVHEAGPICPITLTPFERGDGKVGARSLTLDCIIPSLGYVPGNFAVISHKANTMKSNCTDPLVFERLALYVEGRLETSEGPGFEATVVHRGRLLKGARKRSKENNVPCSLTKQDILHLVSARAHCPITFEPFVQPSGVCGPNSMTLDRIIPDKGYVIGNVALISHFANTLKQDCTDPAVFRRLAAYIRKALDRLKPCP